ncbi:5'-methylthioadenosine/S-adenosylhomocysteine nucleosidase [Phytohabitans sp. ZYX-F-186]|uniref:5'-methylthioadenosine/S-adenosylhomocysteine nucleosidase n=1 Tax=Phytohabitans maris TaxID=3071409 RepID=A0ABU0ZTD5_9ACTN|nr:5'-methylthioadenosine/S-adenosylhomocysteine nucleosidase [Phytohabitans sp. ZYX-F-186]MDQ7910223.1 5'-methylthioadenosine/S-adenosylhomocysteine nucleosidase [Phytohabitans sp. ZYX-F-186]
MNGYNIGAIHHGHGDITVNGPAVGDQTNVYGAPARSQPAERVDVGVLTVLPEETRAVVDAFARSQRYATAQVPGGPMAYHGRFPAVGGGGISAVLTQTLDRGPRSAAVAFTRMRRLWAPPVVLLVGIAGGIGEGVRVGDVVIADQVVYYDARRVSASGTHRRGQDQPAAAVVRHRVNDFLVECRGTVPFGAGAVRVHSGPIGSGDAVVTDAYSDIRRFLLEYNEKTLAVETEAAGVAQACYEEIGEDATLRGWLAIRGISDRADAAKGTAHHQAAAERAAAVLVRLMPFLEVATGGGPPAV